MLADWLLGVDEILNFAQTLAPSWLTGGRASLTCSPLVSADLPQMTERCGRWRLVASVWRSCVPPDREGMATTVER